MKTVLVYPSARSEQVESSIRRARSTADAEDIQVVIGLNGDRLKIPYMPGTILLDFGPGFSIPGSLVSVTNIAYKVGIESFNILPEDLVGFWSDDFYPRAGWDRTMLEAIVSRPDKPFLYPNDLFYFPDTKLVTVPFATRQWWDEKNGGCIWPPMYERYVCDHDIALRAFLAGEAQLLKNCIIEHKNPTNNTRSRDALDRRNLSAVQRDRDTFFNFRRPSILAGREGWVTW